MPVYPDQKNLLWRLGKTTAPECPLCKERSLVRRSRRMPGHPSIEYATPLLVCESCGLKLELEPSEDPDNG